MKSRQGGAALLTALIVVTLIATLAAAMVWRQTRAVHIEAADRARAQANWVLLGALDWARLILREDLRANTSGENVDHLGEVWAVPLAEARLSTFLAAERENATADAGPEAFLSGQIDDAQARYNLANLGGKEISPLERGTFLRLCQSAGLAGDLAERLLLQINLALDASGDTQNAPLRPQKLSQLSWLGVPAAALKPLEPWVVLLPEKTHAVNANTAPREVIAALFEGMDLSTAERLVQARRTQHLKSFQEIKTLLGLPDNTPGLTADRIATGSKYFFVTGRLRLDERVVEQRSLVRRLGSNDVEVVWRERVGLQLGESAQSGR